MTNAIEDAYDTTKDAKFYYTMKFGQSVDHMVMAMVFFVTLTVLMAFGNMYLPMVLISAFVFIISVSRVIYLMFKVVEADKNFDEANKEFRKLVHERTSLSVHSLKKYELEEEYKKEFAGLVDKALETVKQKRQNNTASDYVSPVVSSSILTIDSGSSSCDSSSSDGGSSSCSSD